MQSPIQRRSPAKINLGLEILRKRPDGFHDLETIFYRCSLSDTIRIEPSDAGLTMETDVEGLSTGPDNLCLRAASALREATGCQLGAHITLQKRIPMGAGLGGGSSNAATVLNALNDFWNLRLPMERLRSIAASLGSDVPFFLSSPLAFGYGRGENLDPLPSHFPYWTVTAVPDIHVSTRWAYEHLELIERPNRTSLRERFLRSLTSLSALKTELTNDFELAVMRSFPPVLQTAEHLRAAGCHIVLMSGSGSAVCGITNNRRIAEQAASQLGGSMTMFITPPLTE